MHQRGPRHCDGLVAVGQKHRSAPPARHVVDHEGPVDGEGIEEIGIDRPAIDDGGVAAHGDIGEPQHVGEDGEREPVAVACTHVHRPAVLSGVVEKGAVGVMHRRVLIVHIHRPSPGRSIARKGGRVQVQTAVGVIDVDRAAANHGGVPSERPTGHDKQVAHRAVRSYHMCVCIRVLVGCTIESVSRVYDRMSQMKSRGCYSLTCPPREHRRTLPHGFDRTIALR